jgi:hypothetical protein
MVAQGNPHRIAAPADLAKPGVRLVRRPEGAGAPTQLRRVLDAAKIRLERLTVEAPPAVTESEAAVAILGAKAHAGIALRAVGALFFRLDFIPLRGERFDLAIRRRDSSRRYRGWASPARRTSPRRRRCLAATISVGSAASVTMPDGRRRGGAERPAAGRRHPPATSSTPFLTNTATILPVGAGPALKHQQNERGCPPTLTGVKRKSPQPPR